MVMNRSRLVAVTSMAVVSALASRAYGSATSAPSPPPTVKPLPPSPELDRLLQLLHDMLATGKIQMSDLEKAMADLASRTVSKPSPPPTPDPVQLWREAQKLSAEFDQMQSILAQIEKQKAEMCQKAIQNMR